MKKAVKAAKGTAQVVWLGLASLIGVALLFKLGPMLFGGRDAPEAVTVEAEPLAAPSGSPLPVVDQGSWMVVANERDPMDDSPRILVALESHDAEATLMVACTDNDTDVFIMWGEYLGSDRSTPIVHRFPPAPAQRSRWFVGTGTSVIKRGDIPMVREIINNPELIVRVTPYASGPVTATFDLTGARDAIGKVAEACGWEM